jgi:chromosome partitioning protein
MVKIIAFAGQKGGIGKSTASVALAAEQLARGRRVLLVDGDSGQGSARQWAALAGTKGLPTPTTLIATGPRLCQDIKAVAGNFDYVVIDCPGRLDEVQYAALAIADLAIFPCGDSPVEAWALAQVVRMLGQAAEQGVFLNSAALLTRTDARTQLSRQARTILQKAGFSVLRTEMRFRVAYKEFIAAGMGIGQYAPNDQASTEIVALADEIEALVEESQRTTTEEEHQNGKPQQAVVRR